jgi:hypothetical protein
LYDYKINKNFVQDSTLTVPYDNKSKKYSESVFITPLGGNELNILNLTNAIRNYDRMSFSFVNILEKNFLKNHTFKVRNIVFSDDSPIYEISFSSIKSETSFNYNATGTIYISKQDFAIHKFNYSLFYRYKKSPQYTVTIEYKPKRGKMYLNYITFNNFFEATNGNYFKIDEAVFNTSRNGFKISFSKLINLNSLEPFRRNFKIYFKDEKLRISNVSALDQRTVLIALEKESIEKINLKKDLENPNYANYYKFDITNIKDINGFKIDDRPSLKMNQYREFFVQEVFENKKIPLQKNFVDKNLPLEKTTITPAEFKDAYWLNSPLKKTKE